jgi:hypothetical protein
MKICHQSIDNPEFVAWRNKYISVSFKWGKFSNGRSCRLQEPKRCGSAGYYFTAGFSRFHYPLHSCFIQLSPFRMHLVLFGILDLNGKEGAGAYVQGEFDDIDARISNFR